MKLEKATGAVALAYLVFIPLLGFLGYKALKDLDADVQSLWDSVEPVPEPRPSMVLSPFKWVTDRFRS